MGSFDGKAGEAIAMEPIGTPTGETPGGVVAEVADAEWTSIMKQTRTRRLFSGQQLFAYALTFGITWSTVAAGLYYALTNGGPRGWLFGYILCTVGALAQAASLAEMASVQPIAGAQYYWTYNYAPRNMKMFLTWIQGWFTWIGYVAFLASIVNYTTLTLNGVIISSNSEGASPIIEGWYITLVCLALLAAVIVINLYLFWIVPWLELFSGVVNILLFFATLVILWVMAPRNDASIFLQKSEGSGWEDFSAFHIGLLGNVGVYNLFESGVHMGEETKNPKRAVPKAMFWAWVANAIMGMIMIFTWGITMPADPSAILGSASNPVAIIIQYATGGNHIAPVIMGLLTVVSFVGLIGTFSSTARLTWAWGRDGGLPRYFAMVDGRTRVPMRACWFTALLVALLTLINLNASAFIALGAITALATLGSFCSYAIVIACIISARLRPKGVELGEWNLGKPWGMLINILALAYTVWMIVWLPFPITLPVTAETMNYGGPVFGFVLIAVISWWFLWAKKNWKGPNMKVVEIVLREDARSGKK